MSSSYGTRNIVGTDEKNSRLPWGTGGTGRKSESITSGNDGMAATVLSSGGVFMDKRKIKMWLILITSTFPLSTPIQVC